MYRSRATFSLCLIAVALAGCGDALRSPDGGAVIDATSDADSAGHDAFADADPEAPDGSSADAGSDASLAPDADPGLIVYSTSHPILPRSAAFDLFGNKFVDVVGVSIGGVTQDDYVVNSPASITVNEVVPSTPLGIQELVVTTSGGATPALNVEIIEIDLAPTIVAHGGSPVLTATGLVTSFDASTTLSLGGVAQSVAATSATSVTIEVVADATPTGWQEVALTSAGRSIAPIKARVIHLVINEADPDQPGEDTQEYVEVSAGSADLALDGYVLVFFAGASDSSYMALDLYTGTELSDANGLVIAGNSTLSPSPPVNLQWANNTLLSDGDAIAIYQGSAADFPTGTPVTDARLIDALVSGTDDADDSDLLSVLLNTGPAAVQVNENEHGEQVTQSISRCGVARRDGRVFAVGIKTPRALNTCP